MLGRERESKSVRRGKDWITVSTDKSPILPKFSAPERRAVRAGVPTALWSTWFLPNGGIRDYFLGAATVATIYSVVKSLEQHDINMGWRNSYESEKRKRMDQMGPQPVAYDNPTQQVSTGLFTTIFNARQKRRERKDDFLSFVRNPQRWKDKWEEEYFAQFGVDSPFKGQ